MSRILALATLAVVTVLALLVGCATQAPAPCQIQPSGNGPYTIKLTLDGGTPSAACPAVWGDQWFFDNYANGLIAMVAADGPGVPFPPDPTSSVYGRGTFSTHDPDSNDLCTLPTVNTFDGPNGSTFSVTNLSFLSTALYIGTQWKGEVTYTPDGGSPCVYEAQAINPTTQCATNADCDPLSQPTNSGINFRYNQGCNMDTWATDLTKLSDGGSSGEGICFFKDAFPSLGGFSP